MSENLRFFRLLNPSLPALLVGSVLGLVGCSHGASAGSGGTSTGTGTSPSSVNISGNWEFHATAAQGSSAPFTVLSGFLNEQGSGSTLNFTTASLEVQSPACYAESPTLSLEGSTQNTQLGLTSFSAAGQVLTINGTTDASSTNLTGTFAVAGGCADGQHGQLTGILYAPLNGNYNGPVVGQSNLLTGMHLTLTQSGGTSDGLFFLTGSATFSGTSCFSKGTLAYTKGSVSGSVFHISLDTDETSGSQVTLVGTADPAADTLTITSVSIVGGACAGSAGTATLTS